MCQHPYLVDPSLENLDLSPEEQQKRLTDASGKLLFLKKLLPSLKARGRRVLLFSQVGYGCWGHSALADGTSLQFKIALDRSECDVVELPCAADAAQSKTSSSAKATSTCASMAT